jgi:hypothetical protein
MYVDVSSMVSLKHLVVRRTEVGKKWHLSSGDSVFVILEDYELDQLKYAIDSAVFERDMGFEIAAHAADNSLDDLVHGADMGGKQ